MVDRLATPAARDQDPHPAHDRDRGHRPGGPAGHVLRRLPAHGLGPSRPGRSRPSEDVSGLAQHMAPRTEAQAAEISQRAQSYINSQPTFGTASEQLLVVKVGGAPLATNEPELLGIGGSPARSAARRSAEARQSTEILAAPDGYSTIDLADAGSVRLLTRPLFTGDREAGQIMVGQPLSSVETAQSGVSRAFLVAGSVAFVAALIAVALVASEAPGRYAGWPTVAGAVDAGELSTRMALEGPVEARRLAESFNHMLDRLEEAFARQRAFISDASHELRTPLTAIRGQIEVLSRSRPRCVAGGCAATARGNSRGRPDGAARGRHAPARPARRGTRPRPAAHPRRDAPRRCRLGARRAASTASSRCGRPRAGTVPADRDRITQVIRNLIRNSVEHTAPGGAINVAAVAGDGTARSRSASATTARGSPRRIASGSSSASIESSAPATGRAAAPGSASPSPGQSSRRTAVASGPMTPRRVEPGSRSAAGIQARARLAGRGALRLPRLFAEFSYIG